MVFLIAEYSNKRLVPNRALAAGTSMPGHRLSPFGWCFSLVLASFSAASSGGQPPFQLRAMANTPQPSAGSCRFASSPFRLPCGARFFPLSPAPPKKQTHPLGGFSSRRLLCKSLTPFPGGSPASPRFPLRRIRLTPFPQSCHGFVLCRNRASPEVQPISCRGGVTPPVRVPLSLPILRPRLRPFQKAQKCRTVGNPARAALPINSRSLPAVSLDRRLRKLPLRVFAVPAPLRGMVFQPSEKLLRSAALRGRIFRVLESPRPVVEGFRLWRIAVLERGALFQGLENGAPRCAAPL